MICARLNNVDTIVEELRRVNELRRNCATNIIKHLTFLHRRRLSNNKEQETLTGIEEVKKISRLRAADIVKKAPPVSRL